MDRFTSLHNELLIRILSFLPTKDAAAMAVLSKGIMSHVFPYITNLDFDGSLISHCVKHPYAIERFPAFVAFVDNVLSAYKSPHFTRFRLRVGMDIKTRYHKGCGAIPGEPYDFHRGCLPDLGPAHLIEWISFPLARSGLRELDLDIMVRDPGNAQLPPAIFTCETLEVLKLEVNLNLDQVSSVTSYRLPNLKLFRLRASFIPDFKFLSRLVSSCCLLEDLRLDFSTKHLTYIGIDSPSLRNLFLKVNSDTCGDVLFFNTPNLEYLEYCDNYAQICSFEDMPRLVGAKLCIHDPTMGCLGSALKLLTPVSRVQRLVLREQFLRDLDCEEVKDHLPMFPNLNHLSLGCGTENYYLHRLLLAFLNCSPVLETLVFEEGLSDRFDDGIVCLGDQEELGFYKTSQAIFSCCKFHLKRIVIHSFYGTEREVAIVQFLLRSALVLEELVIHRVPDSMYLPILSLENTLKNSQRASSACSIELDLNGSP